MQERAQTSLLYSSSGIAVFGMRTVQADSCLNPEQIDTLFISVGGQEGGLGGGGGGRKGLRPKIYTSMSGFFFDVTSPLLHRAPLPSL